MCWLGEPHHNPASDKTMSGETLPTNCVFSQEKQCGPLSLGHVKHNPYTWIIAALRQASSGILVHKVEQLTTFHPVSFVCNIHCTTAPNNSYEGPLLLLFHNIFQIFVLLICYLRKSKMRCPEILKHLLFGRYRLNPSVSFDKIIPLKI